MVVIAWKEQYLCNFPDVRDKVSIFSLDNAFKITPHEVRLHYNTNGGVCVYVCMLGYRCEERGFQTRCGCVERWTWKKGNMWTEVGSQFEEGKRNPGKRITRAHSLK